MSDWSSDVCSSDLFGADHRARAWRRLSRHIRAGDREVGRSGGAADQSRAERRPFHRRDPPAESGGGGSALPGDGGSRAGPDDRRRAVRPVRPHRSRSEEHTSELQSLMRTSYAVFCLKKTKTSEANTSFLTLYEEHSTKNHYRNQ